MTLFAKAENTSSHLKMGMMGFQGSGKTHTAASIAIGLVGLMRELKHPAGNRPIAFLDTEKGSDWVKPRIEAAGIELVTRKSRAFSDLLGAVPEAEAQASVLIVDSVTHFWVEFCESYCARRAKELKRTSYRLQFQDWAYLKQEWRRFTDAYVNSSVHAIICGRAGYEYDFFEDDDGKKQLEKTGVKFKAEGEMGYEPDLLVLMERRMNMETKTDEHTAHVVKDRSTMLDGKEFIDPTFETFLPHIRCLNLGGRQLGVDTSRTSVGMIPAADGKDNRATQRKIVLAEIEDMLVFHYPGQSASDKKRKIELCRTHFEASWPEMESVMPIDRLRQGYDSLSVDIEKKPSRYHREVAAPVPATMAEVDSLPDHSAPPTITHQALMAAVQEPLPQAAETALAAPPQQAPSPPAGASPPADPLDIPPALDRRKSVSPKPNPSRRPQNLKDRLLADIPRLSTVQDVLRWSMTMSGVSDMLPKEAQDEVAAAVIARQTQLLNGAAASAH